MNEFEKRVFIRQYESKVIYGPNQTFEEWMDSFENTLAKYHGDFSARKHLFYKEHSRFLKRLEAVELDFPQILKFIHRNEFEALMKEVKKTRI